MQCDQECLLKTFKTEKYSFLDVLFVCQVRARLDCMVSWGEIFLEDDLQGLNRVGANKRL